jgi:hypothetical protein
MKRWMAVLCFLLPFAEARGLDCRYEAAASAMESSGQFSSPSGVLWYRSVVPVAGTARVTVEINQLVLTASLDFRQKTAEFDGQINGSRRVAELTEPDSSTLAAFARDLNDCLTKEPAPALDALLRTVAVWEAWPNGALLSRSVAVTNPTAITMLCNQAKCTIQNPDGTYVLSYTGPCVIWNWYSYAKHDCNQCGSGEPNCQQIVQLGNHYSCNGSVWYWNGSTWVCGEPNHWNRPYEVGNCFGRCGGGCGWRHQYTKDCTNHDACVRNGHSDWSLYCSDEFFAAIDDFLFAPDCY